MNDWYTWQEFCDGVKGLLTVDANRRGAEAFTTGMIRQGAIDLQDFIPAYRAGHEAIYLPADFVAQGNACIGTMPPQAQTQDVWLCNLDTGLRVPVKDISWLDRMQMVGGQAPLNDQNGRVAFSPNGEQFYIYPVVMPPWCVSLFWDGLKLDFKDNELVPFDEGAVMAVAEFVKGKLAREVDRDLTMYQSYFHPLQGSYMLKRRNLYLTAKARTRTQR